LGDRSLDDSAYQPSSLKSTSKSGFILFEHGSMAKSITHPPRIPPMIEFALLPVRNLVRNDVWASVPAIALLE
jgi:hypothetical protein